MFAHDHRRVAHSQKREAGGQLLGRIRSLHRLWPCLVADYRPLRRSRARCLLANALLFGYALAGLMFGGAFTAIGVGLSALIMAGYLSIAGVAFNVFLAIVNGGGLILCGLWMRRV
jgi:hypothetical protein